MRCHPVDGLPSKGSPQTVRSRIFGPLKPNITAISGPPAADGPTLGMVFSEIVDRV